MATGAFPTASHTNTTLASVIGLLWSDKVNNFFREKLYCAKFFTDLSEDFKAGAKSVYIPNVTEMTAHSKSNATVVTVNNPTDSDVTLTCDTWYETSFAIEDKDYAQVLKQYSYMELQMKNAAYTSAAAYEDAIIALFPAFSQTVGTSSSGVADSNIRKAIQYLDEASAPQEDRGFFLTPKQFWTDLQAIDKFSLAINTAGADPLMFRPKGYLYGIPVYVSERIGATSGSANSCLAHKDAISHAHLNLGNQEMGGIRIQANYIPQYLSTVVTADVAFGVIENRDTSGVWIKTSDA